MWLPHVTGVNPWTILRSCFQFLADDHGCLVQYESLAKSCVSHLRSLDTALGCEALRDLCEYLLLEITNIGVRFEFTNHELHLTFKTQPIDPSIFTADPQASGSDE